MKDLCLGCGKEHEYALWGATCSCDKPNVVHQMPCHGCSRVIGIIIDDDYHAPEKLYCPDCVARAKRGEP